MHYVILGTHNAEVCPTGNAKTWDLLLQIAPEIPKIAERNGVNILAGPYANREHITVTVVDSDSSEKLDAFLMESRLAQWNTIHILPSVHMQEAIQELSSQSMLF